jgi:hypothetical protein
MRDLWGPVNLVPFIIVWSNCDRYSVVDVGGRMRLPRTTVGSGITVEPICCPKSRGVILTKGRRNRGLARPPVEVWWLNSGSYGSNHSQYKNNQAVKGGGHQIRCSEALRSGVCGWLYSSAGIGTQLTSAQPKNMQGLEEIEEERAMARVVTCEGEGTG